MDDPFDRRMFEELARWVPEHRRQDYLRYVAMVRDLREDEPVLKIILTMGVLTTLIEEVPSEIGKQLSEAKLAIGEALTDVRRNREQLLSSLREREEALAMLHRNMFSQSHIDKLSRDIIQAIESRMAMYVEPLGGNKAQAFGQKVKALDQGMDLQSGKAHRAVIEVEKLVHAVNLEVTRLQKVGLQLQEFTRRGVDQMIAIERVRRPWPWIIGTTAVCISIIIAAVFTGAWLHYAWEHRSGSMP